jgi:hypothetical protein
MIALRCYARQRRRVNCVARLSCGPAHSYTCQGIETRGALASARPERPCRCSDAVLGARALGRLQRTPPGSPCDSRPAAARGRGHLSLTRHRRGVYAPVSAPPRFLAQAALPWIRQLVLRRRPFPGLGRRRRSRAALFVPQGTTTGGARRSFLPPHPGPPFPRQPLSRRQRHRYGSARPARHPPPCLMRHRRSRASPSPAAGAPPQVGPAGPPPPRLARHRRSHADPCLPWVHRAGSIRPARHRSFVPHAALLQAAPAASIAGICRLKPAASR